MAHAKRRRNNYHSGSSGGAAGMLKPILFGLIIAGITALVFIMIFALVFVIMKAIVASAIIPLSLIAFMLGCFVGGFICGTISRSRGLFYGLAIGGIIFLAVWLVGIAMGSEVFGLLTAVKLIGLLLAGGCGGWLGANHAYTKRSRRAVC